MGSIGDRPMARLIDLRLLRVDRRDRRRRAHIDDQFREAAGAAADVEPAHTRGWCNPVEEHLAGAAAPAAHEALIRRAVIESICGISLGHGYVSLLSSRRLRP